VAPLLRQIKIAFLLFGVLILVGVTGYRVAGLGWIDALYQTVVTITTVGYEDLADAQSVKPFTIGLIAVGTISIAVFISLVTAAVIEAQLAQLFGRRKVENKIRKLTNHIVLCGFGRFGRKAASELSRRHFPFVVIEEDPVKAEQAEESGYLALRHDATEEEALTQAGIERAVGLLSALGTDAANVYVTLTAKQMKRSIKVVAIAQDERARTKLEAAGADEVVLPYQMGGNWMAQAITSPAVADFMKIATGDNPIDFFMDEQRIDEGSRLCGQTLRESPIRGELGVIVVAVRNAKGELRTNPSPDVSLSAGDVLVSIGQRDSLNRLKQMAGGS